MRGVFRVTTARQILRTETYQYASDGRLLEIQRIGIDGKLLRRVEQYDESGNPLGMKYKDAEGKDMTHSSRVSRYFPGDIPINFLKLCAKNAVSA